MACKVSPWVMFGDYKMIWRRTFSVELLEHRSKDP